MTPAGELPEPATTPELVEDVPARFTPGGSRPTHRAGVPWWTFAAIPFVLILVVKRRRRRVHCDRRLTELAILVTARSWDCQLEWTLHEPLALEAGVDTAVVDIIRQGQLREFERQDERIVYDFASELLYNRFVQDRTFSAAREELGEAGVVDLIGLIGYYGLVAMTLNACQVPLPKGMGPSLVDCPTFR